MAGVRLGFIAGLMLLTVAVPGIAAEKLAFDQARFDTAQQANRPILVDITARACLICRAQEPIIDRLAAEPQFKDLTIFQVDFPSQNDVVRAFRAQYRSTLIAFKGKSETGRSVGDTRAASIEALAQSALK
ncbi:MAG: thioredoxin family protein [Alphaproteobacteria bacterium]|nr:thioredoxin family protein [Alphaproteobacteria bacterium]